MWLRGSSGRSAHAAGPAPARTIPSGWPAFKPNTAGVSILVYQGMKDYMRGVAENVVVGKAYKGGKSAGAYFLLARS